MNYLKFHTIVDIPRYSKQTGYGEANMFLGSCFTENIGNRMASLKFNTDINPFGILYNPSSVSSALRFLLNKQKFTESNLVEYGGLWHSFSHHGSFSANNAREVVENINGRIDSSSKFLQQAEFLFITFGTAWIYKYKNTGETVSNCHKIPASAFSRIRLTVDEIVDDYRQLFNEIRIINPNLKIIFTVSPIRHWGDGAIENQRSKAVLLLAIDELIAEYGNAFCNYFPAYEIVMDELRDYRFYAPDMLHISDVAIGYVWEKFEQALIDEKSRQAARQVVKILQAVNHRPLHGISTEYNRFLKLSYEKTVRLEKEFQNLSLTDEKIHFEAEMQQFRTL